MSDGEVFAYDPPGPIAAAAYADVEHDAVALMGPVAAGKTRMFGSKMVMKATMQPAWPDGIRRYKAVAVRLTYRDLGRTTIPSWLEAIGGGDEGRGRELGNFKDGGNNGPSSHEILFDTGRFAGQVLFRIEFHAPGDKDLQDFFRGLQPTDIWLNEADLMPAEVFYYALTRTGRYPPKQFGVARFPQVLLDFNAPDDENWIYRHFIQHCPPNHKFYRQPSGLSPQAENIKNLGAGFYEKKMQGLPDWMVRRFILNEFGYSRDGKPVYPEFKDQVHVAAHELKPDDGLPILVGVDAGGTPSAVFCQRRPNGQWRVLRELTTPPSQVTGAKGFAALVNQDLAKYFPGHKPVAMRGGLTPDWYELPIAGWCDPSAEYGADRRAGEQDWRQMVQAASGFPIRAAPTNKVLPRLEGVRAVLARWIDGEPGFVLSPACPVLRKGFNSGYRYRRKRVIGNEEFFDEIEKNEYSHPHDALQYVILGGGEYDAVMERKSLRDQGPRQRMAITDDNPHGVWAPGGRPRTAITE